MLILDTFILIAWTGTDYRTQAKSIAAEEYEAGRRRFQNSYEHAVSSLMTVQRKTGRLVKFMEYCSEWSQQRAAIHAEVLTEDRRVLRFERFRAVQATIERITRSISPLKDRDKKKIIFFEDGSFQAKKGAASAPRKKIVKVLSCRAVVGMTPAAYSSCTCPECRHETEAGDRKSVV